MDHNPTRDDYSPENLERVRRTCLYVATILGSVLDQVTIVGGLVPSLLVSEEDLPPGFERHVGTMDLDLGLSLALLDDELYATVSEQLRRSGFRPDVNENGNPTLQRWRTPDGMPKVTVDFLIPVSPQGEQPDRVKKLERDFGALVTAGLQLVARDRRKVSLEGTTLTGARARRELWVCGPGAYVVLKARAVHGREKDKDAYDLCYLLQCYADRPDEVAEVLRPLLDDADAREAMEWLTDDFADLDSLGPLRFARFLAGQRDEDLQTVAERAVQDLLQMIGYPATAWACPWGVGREGFPCPTPSCRTTPTIRMRITNSSGFCAR